MHYPTKHCKPNILHRWLIAALAALILGLVSSADSQAEDIPAAGRLVSVEGEVDYQVPAEDWLRAAGGQELPPGTTVRTGPYARASLLLADETLIRLNRNTEFTLSKIPPRASWLKKTSLSKKIKAVERAVSRLKKGELWLLNKDPNAALDVVTPRSHVGVRGTEIAIRVADDQTERVVVLEGAVNVANELGAVSLAAGEEAITRPGSAPQKRIILQPEDAVQWTIVIPALFTPGDFLPAAAGMNRGADPGWARLNAGRYQAALDYFKEIADPDPMILAGRISAFAGIKNYYQAFNSLDTAQSRYPELPVFALQRSWLELLTGDIAMAAQRLEKFIASQPNTPLGWELYSLANLVLDKKNQALKAAEKAATLDRQSPTPLILISYAHQAFFDLEQAEANIRLALERDPQNITALFNLARLQFGQGFTREARQTITTAASLAPENSEVNNLLGFILLAGQERAAAIRAFGKATVHDSGLAEPHLGLGLALMRQGDTALAMEAITSAVLLEPRRSLFRSYWAKILYQLGRLDKALDVLDIARNIDPNDPSPELYRAIILRDLNRPSEAIASLNRAIAMNDNRAVYRSRFLLDQDLAVKNVNLALLYNQLGVSEWAGNKAVASIRDDYTNASAHLFYAGALGADPERSWARNTENLLARLLMPANLNTFNTFNEYTSFMEQPSLDGEVGLAKGNHSVWNKEILAFGAVPDQNLAFQAGYLASQSDGWRGSNHDDNDTLAAYLKWDISQQDSLMLVGALTDVHQRDRLSPRYEYGDPAEPRDRTASDVDRFEVGYHHDFGPGTDLLLHFATFKNRTVLETYNWDTVLNLGEIASTADLKSPFVQLQGEVIRSVADHQIIAGTVFYDGEANYDLGRIYELIPPGNVFIPLAQVRTNQKRRARSYYLHDIWSPGPVSLEAALHYDQITTGNLATGRVWDTSQADPGIGAVWQPAPRHTLRAAAFRYLLPFGSDRLEPAAIAGVPIYRNGTPGSATEEFDLVWEYERDTMFCSINPFYLDRKYEELLAGGLPNVRDSMDRGVNAALNMLVGPGLGLAVSYRYQDVVDEQTAKSNRKEHQATARLQWVRPDGFSAGITEIYRHVDFRELARENENILLTDLEASFEFTGKTGSFTLEARNIFNRRFDWITDQFIFEGRSPAREISLQLRLNF